MSEMYFTKLLVVDVNEKEASFHSFSKGFNVITGRDNHIGKSTILKSLFFALGTEVYYSSKWNKQSKMYVVEFSVDNVTYMVARLYGKYLVFRGKKLVLVTDKVTKGLAQKLAEIFSFEVLLPSKKDKDLELAPPAFTFLPYYIDQDKGWAEMYQSFDNLNQYNKNDRMQGLYYHLGILNKNSLTLVNDRDELKRSYEQKSLEEERLRITIESISKEVNNLVPAEDMAALNDNLRVTKERLTDYVRKLGVLRNKIQELERILSENKYHEDVIKKAKKNLGKNDSSKDDIVFRCPNCGYNITEDIFELVRSKYSEHNKDYIFDQIKYINENISSELDSYKKQYIVVMNQMRDAETIYNANQDEYQTFLKQSGLRSTLEKFNGQLSKVILEKDDINKKLASIRKELRNSVSKKEIEDAYEDYVKANFRKLDIWDDAYTNTIKLLKPVKGQGAQVNKVVLAQYSALFKTIGHFNLENIRFPFVVDSPRTNEPSDLSSKEIISLVFELDMLPQVILATTDFDKYYSDSIEDINFIVLERQWHLLDKPTYMRNKAFIDTLLAYFNNSDLFRSGSKKTKDALKRILVN